MYPFDFVLKNEPSQANFNLHRSRQKNIHPADIFTLDIWIYFFIFFFQFAINILCSGGLNYLNNFLGNKQWGDFSWIKLGLWDTAHLPLP